MVAHFLRQTASFRESHTELFDVVVPASIGLWNLHWQVRGLLFDAPKITAQQLFHKFADGSGLKYRNFQRFRHMDDWTTIRDELAGLFLVGLVALYEGWRESLRLGQSFTKTETRNLQFPTSPAAGRRKKGGIGSVLDKRASPRHAGMERAFANSVSTDKLYSDRQLEDLMIAYRYFKEVRNATTHHGGVAQGKTREAYEAAVQLDAAALNNVVGLDDLPDLAIGQKVAVEYEHAVTLSAIILRVVFTLDAMIGLTEIGADELTSRWHEKFGRKELTTRQPRRSRALTRMCVVVGLPRPTDTEPLDELLRDSRLIF
jgi:hypothetical protein